MENSDLAVLNVALFWADFNPMSMAEKTTPSNISQADLIFYLESVDDTIKLCDDAELRFSSAVEWVNFLLFHFPRGKKIQQIFPHIVRMDKNALKSKKI